LYESGENTSSLQQNREVVTKRQEQFDAAYREWQVTAAVIRSKLEAYVEDTSILSDWDVLSNSVTEFYALEGQDPGKQKNSLDMISSDLGRIVRRQVTPTWSDVRQAILDAKARLNNAVLRARVPAFDTGPLPWRLRKED